MHCQSEYLINLTIPCLYIDRQAISLSYAALSSPSPSNSAPTSLPPTVKPWCPKVKPAPSSQQLLAKAQTILDDMKSDINKLSTKSDVLDWTDLDDADDQIPTMFATPPRPKYINSSKPMSFEAQEHIVFEQVGMVMDINANSEIDEKLKTNVVNLLLSTWHKDEYKPHILGICKFVKEYKLKGIHKLKLLELDLTLLQQ